MAATSKESAPPTDVIDVNWVGASGPSQARLRDAVIKDQGLDAKHGLNLDITELAPDESELAVLTGQVDVGLLPLASWATAVTEGEDLVVLDLASHSDGAVLVRDSSPFQNAEDLVGGTVATLDPGSSMYTSTQVILSRMGIAWPEDFEVLSELPSGVVSFIHSGQVDAIVHYEPNLCQLVSTGHYRVIFRLDEQWQELAGNPLPLTALVSRREWVEENPEAVDRIRAMSRELGMKISTNPEIISDYSDLLELEDETQIQCAMERMAPQYQPFSEEASTRAGQVFLDAAEEEGIIESYPDQIFVWQE